MGYMEFRREYSIPEDSWLKLLWYNDRRNSAYPYDGFIFSLSFDSLPDTKNKLNG